MHIFQEDTPPLGGMLHRNGVPSTTIRGTEKETMSFGVGTLFSL